MTAAKVIAVRTGAALCSIWLAGCSLSQPQSAEEFRNGVPNGIAAGATKDTFESIVHWHKWVHPSKGLRPNACP
jgi:hypothetical protein